MFLGNLGDSVAHPGLSVTCPLGFAACLDLYAAWLKDFVTCMDVSATRLELFAMCPGGFVMWLEIGCAQLPDFRDRRSVKEKQLAALLPPKCDNARQAGRCCVQQAGHGLEESCSPTE